jgi:prephenate dehydrogenase
MDMKSDRVAVIGINFVSASIALGLKAQKEPVEVIGHDADPAVADMAKVRGAFDRVTRKPGPACEGAELVIVAEPLADIQTAFAAISPYLENGAVVTDIARLKVPVLRWAQEFLPQHVSFVGGHLIPNPAVVGLRALESLDDAGADLLRESLYCFTPAPSAASGAIDVCAWLAYTLGAHPLFMDVTEHDGLQAGVEGLPDLLTIALLRATVDTPGWEEMRKFAGHRFASATEAIDDATDRHPSLFLNRENLLHRLDALIEELMRLRRLLSEGNEEALAQAFVEAAEGRSRWMRERRKGMWSEDGTFDTRDVSGAAQQIGRMLFGNLASRLRRAPGESEED